MEADNRELHCTISEDVNGAECSSKEKDECSRRTKAAEASQVLVSQSDAARECAKEEIRRFSRVPVEVDTIGGSPLVLTMWASEQKAVHRKRAHPEASKSIFRCESCGEALDSLRKLQLHKARHRAASDGAESPYLCAVCGKTFDEKRKLTLHSRYHKIKKNAG